MSAFVSVVLGFLAASASVSTLSVEVLPPQPKQGEIVVVTLRSPAPLSSATLSDGTRKIAMEPANGGRMYRALLGIDLESKIGKRKLEVSAADPSGGARTGSTGKPSRCTARPASRDTASRI